jgi:hypothetical protein
LGAVCRVSISARYRTVAEISSRSIQNGSCCVSTPCLLLQSTRCSYRTTRPLLRLPPRTFLKCLPSFPLPL